jgi:lipopolysaccharide export system protein LptC
LRDNAHADPLERQATRIGAPVPRGISLASAYPVDKVRRVEFSATSRADAEEIYRTALRHSRRVRVLRIGVPVVLAAALLAIVGANYMPSVGGLRLPGELGKLVIKGTKVTMQQPRMSGFTVDARPYQFMANSAEQDITTPDLMELHQVQAKMEMEDKSIVNVTSDAGTYDMKSEMMTLRDNVHVVSSAGTEMRLSEAAIDVHKGTVVSQKPVWVKLTNGVINAKRLDVLESGDVIRFSGGVSMVVQPEQDKTQGADQ